MAAKIWLLQDADHSPVPAILEYSTYRYQDGAAERDALTYPHFAGHGYESVRFDMRGSGITEGVLVGEYLEQEQGDALELIEWISAQPACAGAVGMTGIYWGVFNGLQVAARRPPGLGAIVRNCSTGGRYADDINIKGGAMLFDNTAFPTYMFGLNTTPPDPRLLPDSRRDIWMRRLAGSGLWIERCLEHQHRGSFTSMVPLAITTRISNTLSTRLAGWADSCSNSVFRLMSSFEAPFMGLAGLWAHKCPRSA